MGSKTLATCDHQLKLCKNLLDDISNYMCSNAYIPLMKHQCKCALSWRDNTSFKHTVSTQDNIIAFTLHVAMDGIAKVIDKCLNFRALPHSIVQSLWNLSRATSHGVEHY